MGYRRGRVAKEHKEGIMGTARESVSSGGHRRWELSKAAVVGSRGGCRGSERDDLLGGIAGLHLLGFGGLLDLDKGRAMRSDSGDWELGSWGESQSVREWVLHCVWGEGTSRDLPAQAGLAREWRRVTRRQRCRDQGRWEVQVVASGTSVVWGAG